MSSTTLVVLVLSLVAVVLVLSLVAVASPLRHRRETMRCRYRQ
jgi:Na+-transporting NADH:ubiquinone oxidoreductase subunit NqrC